MLVYANEFTIVGDEPALPVLRGISGWLSKKLGEHLGVGDVVMPHERIGGDPKAWLRIDRAMGQSFRLYSWVLKHPDRTVSGRQWITEIGLKAEDGGAHFSCVVYTEELSILVSDPVQASRPKVVGFVFNNVQSEPRVQFAAGSIGARVKWVGADLESYKGLLAEIRSDGRTYPLVLISPDNEGTYYVDPSRLQETLFGLAQVVGIEKEFNSYDMVEVLGREYSAWGGALNIIRTPHRDGRVLSYLMLSRDFPPRLDANHQRESFVLGRVSHNTNVPKQRNRIRPEGVRALAARQRLEKRISELAGRPDEELRGELSMVYDELSSLSDQLEQSQKEKASLELSFLESEERVHDLEKKINMNFYLQRQRSEVPDAPEPGVIVLTELIGALVDPKGPTPEECLSLIKSMYPKRVVVLPTAFQSAREVSAFGQGRRLLDMLNRLVTEYLDGFLAGGDSAARTVFTNNEFAARESDTVVNNSRYLAYRRFDFEGNEVEMLKHLKVGVSGDSQSTIRVHFEVDLESRRVVIGYCGQHLPLPGR